MTAQIDLDVEQNSGIKYNFTMQVLTNPLLDFNAATNPYINADLTGKSFDLIAKCGGVLLVMSSVSSDAITVAGSTITLNFKPTLTKPLRVIDEYTSFDYHVEMYTTGQPDSYIRVVEGKLILHKRIG